MTTKAQGAFGNHPLRRNLYIVVKELIVHPVGKPRRQKWAKCYTEISYAEQLYQFEAVPGRGGAAWQGQSFKMGTLTTSEP